MFKNKGDRLESLIQYVYQEMSYFSNNEIEVKNKYDVVGKSGVTHNLDVYYEFEMNDIAHKVIFECKNWKSRVSKEKVLAFKSIIEDIPNSVGIMVAPKGYQSGAIDFAEHNGIKLISGSEDSLLNTVIQIKLKTALPDENTYGEPFYCLMKKDAHGQVTGSYAQHTSSDKESFLVLCFSKYDAEDINNDLDSVVRGVDKKHLSILCDYSDTFNLKLAIKQFASTEIIGVESDLIKDYFL